MAKLMNLEECMMCQENMEFILKVTITKMKLLGKQLSKGFDGIKLNLTLDSNVIKIENIEAEDENVNIKQELRFQLTPEKFNQKLHISPVMMNLSRHCENLGTIKIAIADCFADAVMCDEFGKETIEGAYVFSQDGISNCQVELNLEITRVASESKEFTDFIRIREKAKAKKIAVKLTTDDLSISDSINSIFSCDADLTTDRCPLDDSESYERLTSRASTSKSMKSSVRSSVKCRSDIATSLDVNDFRDDQKTFCHGCGGVSISGVTCENKEFIPEAYTPLPPSKNQLPVHRICSECFEDLTEIPSKFPCPKCERHKELMRTVSFKNPKQLKKEESKTRNCVRSIFEEILLKDKDRVERDMRRLRGIEDDDEKIKKRSKKVKIVGEKTKKRSMKNPRCAKVRNVLKSFSHTNQIKHPGVVRGHKSCMHIPPLVPKNMGWLWNTHNPGIPEIRRGWRPGAISKPIAKMMKFFLNEDKKNPEDIPCNPISNQAAIQMRRKNGEYTIVMKPAGGSGDGPITFKISKSDEIKKREEAKKVLKKRGIEKYCQCEKIESCKCISSCTKKDIEAALKNISFEYSLQPPLKFSELNESSDSEMDFEFTPPFAMTTSKKCKKPPVSYAATQYEKQEIKEVVVEELKVKASVKQSKKKLKGTVDPKNLKSSAKPSLNKDVKNLKSVPKSGMKTDTVKKKGIVGNPSTKAVQILRDIPSTTAKNLCPTSDHGANRLTTNYNPLCIPYTTINGEIHHPRNFNPSTCY